jgi:hypothetical protein
MFERATKTIDRKTAVHWTSIREDQSPTTRTATIKSCRKRIRDCSLLWGSRVIPTSTIATKSQIRPKTSYHSSRNTTILHHSTIASANNMMPTHCSISVPGPPTPTFSHLPNHRNLTIHQCHTEIKAPLPSRHHDHRTTAEQPNHLRKVYLAPSIV